MHEEATSRPWRTHRWTWRIMFTMMIWLHLSVFFPNDCERNQIECVWNGEKRQCEAWMGMLDSGGQKKTLTVLKLCLRSNYKDQDLTKWLLELLHLNLISFCLFALYERSQRMTRALDCTPSNLFQSDFILYNSGKLLLFFIHFYSSHYSPPAEHVSIITWVKINQFQVLLYDFS